MLCAFDFDGTLADSRNIYYKALKLHSAQEGLKIPSHEDMDTVFGNPSPQIIFDGWGDRESFKKHLLTIYGMTDDLICDDPSGMPLYEGIQDLLKDLNKDFVLSIVTSRSLRPILSLIRHHKIDSYFQTIRSDQDLIDRGYRGKPHPDKLNCVLKEMESQPEKAVMIGDTLMDMAMAKSAGVKAIGVSWGYHDEAILRAHGADDVANTPETLNQMIRGVLR
ncbi:MAG: HAD family hydrolase [Alphaproteobacteria bacterium]|jgi:phosphoglycolate phosphatase|nr:HAD family hydrolase [Alphaproteobacteria bacterium]